MHLFKSTVARIDFRVGARIEYERRIASKDRVLDIGGRNATSHSHKTLRQLSTNTNTSIVSTDVVTDYAPDLVDDICNTNSVRDLDGVRAAVLEHVETTPRPSTTFTRSRPAVKCSSTSRSSGPTT
jgi:hypothetical protein